MDYVFYCFSTCFGCFAPRKRKYYTLRANKYTRLNQLDDVEIENLLGSDLTPFEPKKFRYGNREEMEEQTRRKQDEDFMTFLHDEHSEAKAISMAELLKISNNKEST